MMLVRSAVLAMIFSTSALAQAQPGFSQLTACRVDTERVLLNAFFDGGACQAVEPVDIGERAGTTLAVAIPTSSTAEVCTMQIVPVETMQVLEVPRAVTSLDVSALDPHGNQIAHGITEVDEAGPACMATKG
ncbi:MAG TPA: hypothetical protein VGN60_11790 [Devosia sp.]|nr:hypothetical protein [Devosia sp.]